MAPEIDQPSEREGQVDREYTGLCNQSTKIEVAHRDERIGKPVQCDAQRKGARSKI